MGELGRTPSEYRVALNFLRVLIFAIFAVFFAIHNKKKIPLFSHKNLLHCRNYIQQCWFEGENVIENSVDNTSSGTLVIVDPLSDIDESVLHSHVVLSVFLLYVLKKRKCYHFYLNATSRKSQKLIPGRKKTVFSNRKN